MMLQRLATGATGVKQARYRRRPTRGTRTRMRSIIHNASRVRGLPARGRPPEGGRGGAPDHSLGAGRRQTSQSPRFAHGSLREGLRGSHAHTSR